MKNIKIQTNNPLNKKLYDEKTLTYNEMKQHRQNVYNVMNEIAWYINQTGTLHDWTKESFFDEYYEDIIERKTEKDFKNREWYNIHTKYERHHINTNPPIDVNLIDIIEMIVDIIITGKTTEKGEIDHKYLKIDHKILEEAYWNTIDLIIENTSIEPLKKIR